MRRRRPGQPTKTGSTRGADNIIMIYTLAETKFCCACRIAALCARVCMHMLHLASSVNRGGGPTSSNIKSRKLKSQTSKHQTKFKSKNNTVHTASINRGGGPTFLQLDIHVLQHVRSIKYAAKFLLALAKNWANARRSRAPRLRRPAAVLFNLLLLLCVRVCLHNNKQQTHV